MGTRRKMLPAPTLLQALIRLEGSFTSVPDGFRVIPANGMTVCVHDIALPPAPLGPALVTLAEHLARQMPRLERCVIPERCAAIVSIQVIGIGTRECARVTLPRRFIEAMARWGVDLEIICYDT
jgi:hypothetical protein